MKGFNCWLNHCSDHRNFKGMGLFSVCIISMLMEYRFGKVSTTQCISCSQRSWKFTPSWGTRCRSSKLDIVVICHLLRSWFSDSCPHPGQRVIVKLGWCRELGCTDEEYLAVVDEKHTISILKIIINKNKCLIHQIQCWSYIRLFLQRENPYLTHKKQK
jgi:hypothetical protein